MTSNKDFLKFDNGVFKPYFVKYIDFKRGKGDKVSASTIQRLRVLNRDLNAYGVLKLDAVMIEQLLAPENSVSESSRQSRVSDLRQFSEFLNILGIKSDPVSSSYMRTVHCKFRPHIFTENELKRIVYSADHLSYGCRSHEHVRVYPVIIRILIGTGMRIGEVLQLKASDVDIDNGVIQAVNCKGNVSRYIPMADSLAEVLRYYISSRCFESLDLPLFISPYTQQAYSYDAMRYMFKKLCIDADVYTFAGKTPNIHSIRHTFCTRSLEKMLSSGMSLYVAVPILAAYVGHVNLRDTEKYIHFTEQDYQQFIQSESSLRGLIPEVDYDK
ncbi:MAG TPA: tyrosine-type recombinase/integrase [Oscillospiraceae bacterium]|nr:tyrosine-type recombinase/integrase [Fastidiosipila sp.]HZJ90567.1 tyrosine-type recombinase/integrase [Oscillospiraceae bacterium]